LIPGQGSIAPRSQWSRFRAEFGSTAADALHVFDVRGWPVPTPETMSVSANALDVSCALSSMTSAERDGVLDVMSAKIPR